MIKELQLYNFRNYERKEVRFGPGTNVVIGKNGCGKTNLLEAVFLLLQGRSMRTGDAREMVRQGEERASIGGVFELDGEVEKRVVIEEEGTLSGKREVRNLRAVSFQPDDIWMVKGGPEIRRKYLDEVILGLKKGYRETLREYQRVLRQRNEAIKAVRRGEKGREHIRNWNPLLREKGTSIVEERRRAAGSMQKYMSETGERWNKGSIEMRYYTSMGGGADDAQKVGEKIERMEEAEIRRGTTLIGPHRDELLLSCGGRNVRRECSQGEQKIVTVMWRLAQARAMEKEAGRRVLLLMDDCLSELDEENRGLLLREVEDWEQALVTTTDDSREFDGVNRIWIEEGAAGG